MTLQPIKLYRGDPLNELVETFAGFTDFSGGGGSMPFKLVTFDFAFDTPGLVDGVAAYIPAVGERLIDAWFETVTVWDNGYADLSQFTGADAPQGLYYVATNGNPPLLSAANGDTIDQGGGPANQGNPASASGFPLSMAWLINLRGVAGGSVAALQASIQNLGIGAANSRAVPAKFTTIDPVLVVVSSDGTKGGGDAGATLGASTLCMIVAAA